MLTAWLVAAAGALPATAGADAGSVPLTHKTYRTWSIELPAERFAPVGDGVAVRHQGGERFPAETDGVALLVDTDGDGATDARIEGTEVDGIRTAYVVLKGTSPEGNEFRYGARLTERGAGWQYAPGSAAQGKIGETRVRIIDQDLNGRYDDYGTDAMILGRGELASYLSRVVSVGGELYEIVVAPDGTRLDYQRYEGPTGTLDALTGCDTNAKVRQAIVQSPDGQLSFDLATTPDPMRLPVGAYLIAGGRLALGTGTVDVRRGKSGWIRVEADQTTTLAWGGPVRAEFQYARAGGEVAFLPDRVWYYGAAGEQYTDFSPFGASPKFSIKEAGTGTEIETAIFGGC